MNLGKYILAGSIALALAPLAQAADVTIKIAGSTAYRSATVKAIESLMVTNGSYKVGADAADETGANRAILSGTIKVGSTKYNVTVQCGWSGSVGGIQSITQNQNTVSAASGADADHTWLADIAGNYIKTSTTAADGLNCKITADLSSTAPFAAAAVADVTMSDSLQASTGYRAVTLKDTPVGVVTFQWVANVGAPASLDNMTPGLVSAVMTASGAPLSMWTSNEADIDTIINAIGRNFDSGTRLAALAESGFGVFNNVYQYEISTSGGVVTDIQPYHAETIMDSRSYALGQSGYASGGSVATALQATGSTNPSLANPCWLISYLGTKDAAGVITAGGHAMNWNGVPFSTANVKSGKYTFWTYEHLMYRTTAPQMSTTAKSVADLIASTIKNTDPGQAGVKYTDMYVTRAGGEGSVVTHK